MRLFLTGFLVLFFYQSFAEAKIIAKDGLNIVCNRIDNSYVYDIKVLDISKRVAEVKIFDRNLKLISTYNGNNPDEGSRALVFQDYYGLEFRMYTFTVIDFLISFDESKLENALGANSSGNFKVKCQVIP
ncbi:MAG TPA: hypothetical protein PKC28_11655 [Bdellovibrionales bacterium]|nr:hypothetical protein [Bdellovibrionales bacterium]